MQRSTESQVCLRVECRGTGTVTLQKPGRSGCVKVQSACGGAAGGCDPDAATVVTRTKTREETRSTLFMSRPTGLLHGLESLVEVANQVLDVLDADGDPDEAR